MKGMSFALLIVVTAIVIIVVALVVITMFTGGIGNMSTLTGVESSCRTAAEASCRATGQLPVDWESRNKIVIVGDTRDSKSCKEIPGLTNCQCVPDSTLGHKLQC